MSDRRDAWWRHAGVGSSVIWMAVLTLAAMLVGFVWLPSVHTDYGGLGLWQAICRAAGVPARWSEAAPPSIVEPSTRVVLTRAMAKPQAGGAAGRGATLALNCTMCHGALGMSTSNSPNLAGQYPEVVIKQLHDYKSGRRTSAIMQALAQGLSDRDIQDLAAYYASLPRARTAPTTYDESLPVLVRVGDPLRNIAPCISCHGGVDQKLGAPWLEGMPKDYLVAQLVGFAQGSRRNDAHGQMRLMVRTMTAQEMDQVSTFYARKSAPAGVAGH
jgi:cytochrome c553